MKKTILALLVAVTCWCGSAHAGRILEYGRVLNDSGVVEWRGAPTLQDLSQTEWRTDGWEEFGIQVQASDTATAFDSTCYRMVAEWSYDLTTWVPMDSTPVIRDHRIYRWQFPIYVMPYARLRFQCYTGAAISVLTNAAVWMTAKGLEW